MGQALYRKYRPRSLSEVVGQEHVTITLANAIKSGKISHAYLFTGPHGVGKTSVARILAHEVNGLPYDDASTHLDIIEIDAASNRRIDEIRDLRDKVHISPTSAKYKVYIIDEVHMLTKEAFNALLKTLEEPPAHVIFILATTEAHKLPETIISRTQRYSFKPIDKAQVIEHLKSIAKTERIKADPEVFDLIAEHGDGSFRDSISLLDQSSDINSQLTLSDVQRMLGIAPEAAILQITAALQENSIKSLIKVMAELRDQGYQAANIAKQLSQNLRIQIITNQLILSEATSLHLLRQLLDVPASQSPDQLLEIILLEVVLNRDRNHEPVIIDRVAAELAITSEPKAKTISPEETVKKVTKTSSINEEKPIIKVATQLPKPKLTNFDQEIWPAILNELKKQHSTLYGVLRMSQASLDGDTMMLQFKFAFHQKQMKESKNHQKFTTIVSGFINDPLKFEYLLLPKDSELVTSSTDNSKTEPAPKPNVDAISNIFGGAEVLDS
jgi:DNA polymerase-3 subunit gamma/tau